MEKWWMSEITGELQKNLFGVIVVTVQNMFLCHFIDFTWHRLEVKKREI